MIKPRFMFRAGYKPTRPAMPAAYGEESNVYSGTPFERPP